MQRIMVIGKGGSGKSTFALQLGKKLNIPVHHLDQHFWDQNWQPMPESNWIKSHDNLLKADTWIIEGGYPELFAKRAARADTIIFLNLPKYLRTYRWFKRLNTYRGVTRPDLTDNNIERFNWAFFKYLLTNNTTKENLIIKQHANTKKIHNLKTRKQVNEFLAEH